MARQERSHQILLRLKQEFTEFLKLETLLTIFSDAYNLFRCRATSTVKKLGNISSSDRSLKGHSSNKKRNNSKTSFFCSFQTAVKQNVERSVKGEEAVSELRRFSKIQPFFFLHNGEATSHHATIHLSEISEILCQRHHFLLTIFS